MLFFIDKISNIFIWGQYFFLEKAKKNCILITKTSCFSTRCTEINTSKPKYLTRSQVHNESENETKA